MSEQACSSNPLSILLFSRGRGFGHAVPDVAIAAVLPKYYPRAAIKFASYASGAVALGKLGIPYFDLQVPEVNGYLETLFSASEIIKLARPDVIVSHEEFGALAAAHLHGVPAIFLSDWLPPKNSLGDESLRYCTSIVMMEEPGIFEIPRSCSGKRISYLGPMVRSWKGPQDARASVRREMNIEDDEYVVVVSPGGWASEVETPIFQVVNDAFKKIPAANKKLLWVSDKDYDYIKQYGPAQSHIRAIRFADPLTHLLAASDLLITKGTRITTLEAASLGVRSISLSFGNNPIDDILLSRIRSNIALNARAISEDTMFQYMQQARESAPLPPQTFADENIVAKKLADELQTLTGSHRGEVSV